MATSSTTTTIPRSARAISPPLFWADSRFPSHPDLYAVRNLDGSVQLFSLRGEHALRFYYAPSGAIHALLVNTTETAPPFAVAALVQCVKRGGKREKTAVQYNSDSFCLGDFSFFSHVRKGQKIVPNIQGGHGIDDQYGGWCLDETGQWVNLNTLDINYSPQPQSYNEGARNFLVRPGRCSHFVEIPLLTLRPPLMQVKGRQEFQPLPVGSLLLTEKDEHRVYYFPANVDYPTLNGRLREEKKVYECVTPYFALFTQIADLLKPCVVESRRDLQRIKDNEATQRIRTLMQGLSLTSWDGEGASKLMYGRTFEGRVDPSTYMAVPTELSGDDLLRTAPAFEVLTDYLYENTWANVFKASRSLSLRLKFLQAFIRLHKDESELFGDEQYAALEELAPYIVKSVEQLVRSRRKLSDRRLEALMNILLYLAGSSCIELDQEIPTLTDLGGQDSIFLLLMKVCFTYIKLFSEYPSCFYKIEEMAESLAIEEDPEPEVIEALRLYDSVAPQEDSE